MSEIPQKIERIVIRLNLSVKHAIFAGCPRLLGYQIQGFQGFRNSIFKLFQAIFDVKAFFKYLL